MKFDAKYFEAYLKRYNLHQPEYLKERLSELKEWEAKLNDYADFNDSVLPVLGLKVKERIVQLLKQQRIRSKLNKEVAQIMPSTYGLSDILEAV